MFRCLRDTAVAAPVVVGLRRWLQRHNDSLCGVVVCQSSYSSLGLRKCHRDQELLALVLAYMLSALLISYRWTSSRRWCGSRRSRSKIILVIAVVPIVCGSKLLPLRIRPRQDLIDGWCWCRTDALLLPGPGCAIPLHDHIFHLFVPSARLWRDHVCAIYDRLNRVGPSQSSIRSNTPPNNICKSTSGGGFDGIKGMYSLEPARTATRVVQNESWSERKYGV